MATKQIFKEKESYINDLNKALKPLHDFNSIEYARNALNDNEYIKVSDTIGGCQFLDATGMSLEDVLIDVSQLVLGKVPASMVMTRDDKRKIAPLFR